MWQSCLASFHVSVSCPFSKPIEFFPIFRRKVDVRKLFLLKITLVINVNQAAGATDPQSGSMLTSAPVEVNMDFGGRRSQIGRKLGPIGPIHAKIFSDLGKILKKSFQKILSNFFQYFFTYEPQRMEPITLRDLAVFTGRRATSPPIGGGGLRKSVQFFSKHV